MNEPVDLSGLDFAVDMMRRPNPERAAEQLGEQLALVTTDRDIKAANLQLLVENVLAHEAASDALVENTNAALEDMLGDALEVSWRAMVDLARGLKQ